MDRNKGKNITIIRKTMRWSKKKDYIKKHFLLLQSLI